MSLLALVVVALIVHAAECAVKQDLVELKRVAESAAGVYRHEQKGMLEEHARTLRNTIVVTAANHAYANHIHNFKCWMDRIDMKVLVFSMDEDMHSYMKSINTNASDPTLFSFMWNHGTGTPVIKGTADFRTAAFHTITTRKIEVVLELLQLEYNVLFIDTDIALVRDPFPYLLWQNVDYVHSMNKICPQADHWNVFSDNTEGNTGFYFIRASAATRSFYELVVEQAPSHPVLDDQNILWLMVRNEALLKKQSLSVIALPSCRDFNGTGLVRSRRLGKGELSVPFVDPKATGKSTSRAIMETGEMELFKNSSVPTDYTPLVMCPLDGCLFSAGPVRGVAYMMLEEGLKHRGESQVSVHANYLKGNHLKMAALKKFGYWLAVETQEGELEGEGAGTNNKYGPMCKAYEVRTCGQNPRMCTKGG